MSPSGVTAEKPRQTQADRRAGTRQALLDAMLECLVEQGYGGLTTRGVAERAGVSPATQRFYFPSRAAFVSAAVERLVDELLRHVDEHPMRAAPTEPRFEAWLDELWRICNGPAFHAMMELGCAARTDRDARDGFARAERALTAGIARSAAELFPEQLPNARFRVLVDLATASMRGFAMLVPVAGRDRLEARWQAVREQLLELHAQLFGKASA